MVAGLVHHLPGISELIDSLVTEARALVDERLRFARRRHELRRLTLSYTPFRQAFRIQER